MRRFLGKPAAAAVVLVVMAVPRPSSCYMAAATARSAFAVSPLRTNNMQGSKNRMMPSKQARPSRLGMLSTRALMGKNIPSLAFQKHYGSNGFGRMGFVPGSAPLSFGRPSQHPQSGLFATATPGSAQDLVLVADLVGVEGKLATLKVREDGQGTLLQGLHVEFEDGSTGTVIWQRTPLLFVLVNSNGKGQEIGKAASIRTSKNVTVPSGESLIGRVVDYTGAPLDGGAPVTGAPHRAMFGTPTLQRDMATISKPLHTGITSVDALTPIGRGQNMLVVGTLDGGRKALAIDAVCNQAKEGVNCVYVCLQRDYKDTLEQLKARGAMSHTAFVACGTRDDGFSGAAECVAAAATGCAIAEEMRKNGKDSLVVIDDLDIHRVFWDRTERTLVENFGVGAVAANSSALNAASSEMRAFYASLFQRVGYLNNRAGGGSMSMIVLMDRAESTKAKESYSMDDFDPTVYGAKVRTRLQLMVDKGITLTPTVLRKLDIPVPEVQQGSGRFQLMRIEEMMSLSDGHIMLTEECMKAGRTYVYICVYIHSRTNTVKCTYICIHQHTHVKYTNQASISALPSLTSASAMTL
jgi:F0F1-type ATP synthase alpha subunit